MDTKPVRPINKGGSTHDIQPRRQAVAPQASEPSTQTMNPGTKSKRFFVATAVLLFLVGAVAAWMWHQHQAAARLINTSRYQSITLDNGKVYFGKLSNVNDDYMKITDVYYLRAEDDSAAKESAGSTTTNEQNPTLIKHGTELANPEDEIVISKDDITLWENLKDSGKVVDAIKNYKSQQGQ